MSRAPDVSVVVATLNRAELLEGLFAGLRAQRLDRNRFEVVVVDDGSTDETPALLEAERERGELDLRVITNPRNEGLAPSRQRGWHSARAGLLAFTDDDCVPQPGWLEAGLETARREGPTAIVQGRTEGRTSDLERMPRWRRPFTRTLIISGPDPHLQTCNAFYPRAVLESVGGLDTEGFARYVGDDADLAWRARGAGATAAFEPGALVEHAFVYQGPAGKLRYAAGWDFKVYALHPGLRRAYFTRRWFWKGSHYFLFRALVGALLPRQIGVLRRPLRAWLAVPYAVHLLERGRLEGGGPLLAPYYFFHDLIEVGAALRSTARYRKPML
ncbi:MAG: glycosyltransferase family 2 protein [Solirubrobacterales bacterium]